jgi:hypothetical protein
MGFIKNAIVGIAIYEAIKYLTKKDALGTSKFEHLSERAPEWLEKAKEVTSDIRAGKIPDILTEHKSL